MCELRILWALTVGKYLDQGNGTRNRVQVCSKQYDGVPLDSEVEVVKIPAGYVSLLQNLLVNGNHPNSVRYFVFGILQSDSSRPFYGYFRNPVQEQVTRNSNANKFVVGKIKINTSGPSLRIWRTDDPGSPCSKYERRFGIGIPQVWLVSFPGSGNSWTRYLLEAATGVFTGSVYHSSLVYVQGFLGEYEDVRSGTTLTQKTHGKSVYKPGYIETDLLVRRDTIDPNIPTILLLRNPLKAFISYWKYRQNNKKKDAQTSQVSLASFQSKEFRDYVKQATFLWEQLSMDVLIWTKAPLHILHYEHLQQNTTHYLGLLLDFLGIPIDERRMACASSHLEGPFKRHNLQDFDPFSLEERERITYSVQNVHQVIKLMGHQEPPVYEHLLTPKNKN